jgi:hypothetical protein
VPALRLVCYIVLDEPQGGHHGSETGGPVFVDVMNDALRWLGVQPTEAIVAPPVVASVKHAIEVPPLEGDAVTLEDAGDEGTPDLRGLGLGEALARASRSGLRLEVVGSGVAVEQTLLTDDERHTRLRVTFRPPG